MGIEELVNSKWALGSFIAAQVADAVTTFNCLSLDGASELNPFVQYSIDFMGNPAGIIVGKLVSIGLIAPISYAMNRVSSPNKLGDKALYIFSAISIGVALHNYFSCSPLMR